ncbi:MAG: LysR substrate-binding domain-containing protein [Alphaproteobacteria bacterium]|nr:LysR substrate-binding domain-containing protein [Alphaproteobacteria bacterium]
MNHAQLRAFHLVAREGSFTRAARAAGLSQPNLSGQVKALEAAYGIRLFERRGRFVQMTEIGRQLYAVTDRLFALEGDAEALLAGSKELTIGQLRISADNAVHAMPIMAELKHRHAGLALSLAIGNSDAVLRQLGDYQADVGVTAREPPAPRFHSIPYRRDRLIVFVPRGHALAGRRTLAVSELEGLDMVLREPGSVTRAVFEQAMAKAHVRIGAIMDIDGREAVREAVASGLGVGVAFAREFVPDERFAVLEVPDAAFDVGEYVVCLAERLRLTAVRAFMRIAQEMADPAGTAPIPRH